METQPPLSADTTLPHITWREALRWLLRRRRRYRVTGDSMQPLLRPGDEVLIDPHTPPQPGDIVVCQHPFKTDVRLIKRIVGQTETGHYILMGSNLPASTDSRSFGPVPPDKILGRVTSRF